MLTLADRIRQADALLAPYAVKHGDGLGREGDEPQDETRLRFQRDRGRIVHTQAFRRLKGKTQVFIGSGNDHHRTRLTHTLEVTGISRDIARTLQLNEDLAECIALAHDLGHPPFGHAGEAALDAWMKERGSSFEHNLQSHRILTLLEMHSSLHAGLNVNREILEGLLKHRTIFDHPHPGVHSSLSLEAQVVDSADEISYAAHDCEDGLRAGLFSLPSLMDVPLVRSAQQRASPRGTSLRGALIHLMVMDLYDATNRKLLSQRMSTLDDVRAARSPLVVFSLDMRTSLNTLHSFLFERMYNHPSVLRCNDASQRTITTLCNRFEKQPSEKVLEVQRRTGSALPEAVKDYVAGMTDAFANSQAKAACSE